MNNYSVDMALNIKSNPAKNASNKVQDKSLGEDNISIEKKYSNNKKDDFKKLLEKSYQRETSSSRDIKKDATLNSKDEIKNEQLPLKEEDNVSNISEDNNSIINEESDNSVTNTKSQEELILLLLQNLINGKLDIQGIKEENVENLKSIEGLSKELTLDIVAMLKQQFPLSEEKANSLYESINKEIMSMLSNSLSEETPNNISIKDILSNLSEKISKEVYSDDVVTKIINPGNESNLKEKIQETLQSKLSNSDGIQETKTQILGNNISNSSSEGKDLSNSSGKEDKFLKQLASLDKSEVDTKMDKVTNFINGFNKAIITNNPTEATQNITVKRETFVNDVIKSIKFMDQNNIKEMTVKIVPRELGEVIIKLTMENGLMKANITAQNKEAYNLLNSNLQEISNKISNTEIKIQNFAMDIYNGDTTFFSNENSKEDRKQYESNNKGSKSKGSSISDEIETVTSIDKSENNNLNAFV